MAARNTLANKKLRRIEREENRRRQEKKRLAQRVKSQLQDPESWLLKKDLGEDQ